MSTKKELEHELGRLRGVYNDVDSIKHMLRGVRRGMDAVLTHLGIALRPDALDTMLYPSSEFINEVVLEARFPPAPVPPVKKRRKRRSGRGKRR